MNVWTPCLLLATCALMRVSCLPKREILELMNDYMNEGKPFDVDGPITGDVDGDIFRGQGNADNELDIEPLLNKLVQALEFQPELYEVRGPAVRCHDIPGLKTKVRFCVGVSSFDHKTETVCLRADVTIVKHGKTSEYGAKLGCIRFPKTYGQEVNKVTGHLGNREAFKMASVQNRPIEEVSRQERHPYRIPRQNRI